ncbi:unnamed protein product [Nezara viridula]|uniref:Uncharacterized protein n=1 Tax=Nezara viridula TaxID=85310 RepID=A0A9P0MVE2_NEZVI|nr:unnamed protein product [Nezara viridula]
MVSRIKPEGRRPRGSSRLLYCDFMERLGRVRGSTMADMRRRTNDRDQLMEKEEEERIRVINFHNIELYSETLSSVSDQMAISFEE